jgi:hypothetical protein
VGRGRSDIHWITSEVFTSSYFGHLGFRKLIIGGGQAFLVFVIAAAKEEMKDLQDIPMVRVYPDVFSTDYFGFPP